MKDRLIYLLDRILPKRPAAPKAPEPPKKKGGLFNLGTVPDKFEPDNKETWEKLKKVIMPRALEFVTPRTATGVVIATDSAEKTPNGFGMDDFKKMTSTFDSFNMPQVPQQLAQWFAAQSFIGYQMCAILAQQWLINKACVMPAEDAIRKGWDVTLNDGTELSKEQLDYIRELDVKYGIMGNLKEYVQFSRVFGIRIAMFLVDNTDDPKYYEKPFNFDSVKPGKYKGITQIDPYWIAPELDMAASADPVNKHFYEPTWWRMSGLRVHRSHLCVLIPNPVADVLKPTYFFGGVPLTQQIYERVYNGESCANEAVQLLQTKRCNVLFGDIDQALTQQAKFEGRLGVWAKYRDNYGVKILGEEEKYEQHDTSLADLDNTILTQYKLVAAIAGVPAAKLLQDSPAGSLNANGAFESESYRQALETLQSNDLTPVLTKHYQMLIRSDIVEKYPELKGANLIVKWNELDALTETERADVNLKNAQTDQALVNAGAIDGQMAHDRVVKDPNSGYTGVQHDVEPADDDENDEDPDNQGDDKPVTE